MPLREIVAGEFGALLTIDTAPLTVPAEAGAKATLKLVDWPAFRLVGNASPLVLKPLPVALTCVIDKVPVPLLVSWMVCELGEPMVTFPKLALVGVIVKAGWTALPLTGITADEPLELETVIFPVIFSDAVGLKLTLIAAFWPAFRVSGMLIPETLKSFALTVICEMVTLLLPLFVMVTLLELLLPAVTFVKDTLVGLAESTTEAATPVPVRVTTFGEFGALLEMLMLPLKVPAVVGANNTLNVALAPAAIVAGVVRPLTL